jgi:hypothetical protein
MAKRKIHLTKTDDYKSWNFILFLTLAFMLLVFLLSAIGKTSEELRSRAGLSCPVPVVPEATACPGGWKYTQDALNKCPTFVCEAK